MKLGETEAYDELATLYQYATDDKIESSFTEAPSLRDLLMDPPEGAFDRRVEDDERLINDLYSFIRHVEFSHDIEFCCEDTATLLKRAEERLAHVRKS